MKWGKTTKIGSGNLVQLERRILADCYQLTWQKDMCPGCTLCASVCRQEAIRYRPGKVENGRLAAPPTIEIQAEDCNLCGACVVICPGRAFRLKANGQRWVPVEDTKVLPVFQYGITVDAAGCTVDCQAACAAACPLEAITVATAESEQGPTVRVHVDRDQCFYCQQCAAACPEQCITVNQAYEGALAVAADRCPPGCSICADACPTDALQAGADGVTARPDFCLFCGVCADLCPAEGALTFRRYGVKCSQVRSGTWLSAVEILFKSGAKAGVLAGRGGEKRARLYRSRIS